MNEGRQREGHPNEGELDHVEDKDEWVQVVIIDSSEPSSCQWCRQRMGVIYPLSYSLGGQYFNVQHSTFNIQS